MSQQKPNVSNIRRVLFWVGGNVLLFALTWAFIAVVGEVWLRLRWFPPTSRPMHFVPKVGRMLKPNAEVRKTDSPDFSTVSHTNSWGFLDREPIAAERTAASCHIALIKERADRDRASLVILSTHTMGTRGTPIYDRLHALATARGIPVIDQFDYIRRQGAESKDARWSHDGHWNAAGHQWAAEAVLEYLKQNPAVCRASEPR